MADINLQCSIGIVHAPPVVVADDFSGNLSKWTVTSGTWTIETGELSGTTSVRGQNIKIKDYVFSDCSIEVSVKWVSGTYFEHGIMFRAQTTGDPWQNCYIFYITKYSNTARVLKVVNGSGTTISYISFTPSTNIWYKLRVEAIANRIRVFVNNVFLFECLDSSYIKGAVGLATFSATSEHVHYDNFTVSEPFRGTNDFSGNITVKSISQIQGSTTVNAWNVVTAYYSVVPVYKLNFPSSVSVAKANDVSSSLLINAWNAITALYEAVQPPVKHIHVPCIADALLREAKPTQNFGSTVTLGLGYSPGDSARLRSIMKFDVATVTPGLSMTQAVLRIYSQGKPTPPILQAYQVLTDWTEYGVTWNGQPGIRFIPEIEVEGNITPGYIEFDITQLFDRWYSGQYPNYGVLLRLKDESLEQIPYYSREYPNSDQKPEIIFYYKIVATPARVSLESSISVRRKPVSNLSGSITARLTKYSNVNGNLTVLRADTLRSVIKVHRNDTLECDINVSQPAVLSCSISAKQHYTLFGSITVNVGVVSEVKGLITVHNPNTLPCDVTVNRADTLPCSISIAHNMTLILQSNISIRWSLKNDLSGAITARRSDFNALSSSISIKAALNEDFSSSMIISKKEISGTVNVVYKDNADLISSISARRQGTKELTALLFISRKDMPSTANIKSISQIQGSISIRCIGSASLPSRLGINIDRISGNITVLPASNLPCSIRIISGWLACSIRVIQTTSIQAQVTARQKDVSEILGEITVGRGAQNSQGGVMYIPGGFLE